MDLKTYPIIFSRCLIVLSLVLTPLLSHSHSEHTGEEPDIRIFMNFLEKLGRLNIDSEINNQSMRARVQINPLPFFNFGGKKIYIDNAFWDMTDELTRIYLREIKKACAECEMPSIDEIRRQAQDMVAKDWFKTKAVELKDAIAYRYAGQFISLGARYGVGAGIAKIAGELIEDAMLVIFKMPGAHFLCEAITAFIAAYSGNTLTITRALMYGKYFNRGRISTLVRLGVTSYYIKRALKKITPEVPEYTLNEELLKEFKTESPDRKLVYRFTNRHRVDRFFKKLEAEVAKKRAYIDRLQTKPPENLSKKQQQELIKAETEGLQATLTFKKKIFDGYRYKLFFLLPLNARNRSGTLHSFAPQTSTLLKGTNFWFLELKNEIFEPHVVTDIEKEARRQQVRPERALSEIKLDAITQYQLSQFENGRGQELAAHIFNTLDKIGDKTQKSSHRYLNVMFVDAFFGQVLPRVLGEIIEHSVHDLDRKERKFLKTSRLSWKAGRLSYFTDVFADFVRFSAFDMKNADPTMKYNIRDYALQILKSFSDFSQFEIHNAEDMKRASDYLDEQIRKLNAGRFWIEKYHKPKIPLIPKIPTYLSDKIYNLEKNWSIPLPEFTNYIPIIRNGGPTCESIYL